MTMAEQGSGPGGAQAPVAARPVRRARPNVQIETLRDDSRLRLWRHRGQSSRLVVAFSGVGRDRRQPPRLELVKSASGSGRDHVLYVADPARSWLNAPGLIEEIADLVQAEAARIGAAEIVAVGHSLGGFSALVLGGFVPLAAVLALSPQLSVDPAVVPDEPRWSMFRKQIAEIRISRADVHLVPDTQYFILFGKHRREAPQLRLVPAADHVRLYLLPGVRHDSVRKLAEAEVLDDVIALAFARRPVKLRRLLHARMGAREMRGEAA